MKQVAISLLLILFSLDLLFGAEDIYHRESVRKGIELMYNLDYAGAQKIFDQIKKDDPESPVGYGMTALNAWHHMLFASRNLAIYEYGIPTPVGRGVPAALSDTPEMEHFQQANQALQDFCEELLKRNPQDALALYFESMSYENLTLQVMTFDRKWNLARKYAKTADRLSKETLSLDPGLIDAKTSSATIEYVVGSLGFLTKLALRLIFGLKGDKEGAVEDLREVGEKGLYRSTDAKVVLAYLQAWKGDPQVAVSILDDLRKKHPRSFLYDVGLATAYSDAANNPKSAVPIYQELLDNMPSKAPGVYPGEIHFRIAKCYIQLRDYSLALEQFRKALNSERRDSETEPLAYYHMALIYEERGEKKPAEDCYRYVADYSGPTVLIKDEIKRARKKVQ
jgi:tetratricopeptide (TPR) repeat protein